LPHLSHFFPLCPLIHSLPNFYPFFIFPDLCLIPPLTPNYVKLFQINPSLCPASPFMSNYAHLSTFPPLLLKFPTFAQLFFPFAKIILFFSILPKSIRFCLNRVYPHRLRENLICEIQLFANSVYPIQLCDSAFASTHFICSAFMKT
jgi:hypothetical protein